MANEPMKERYGLWPSIFANVAALPRKKRGLLAPNINYGNHTENRTQKIDEFIEGGALCRANIGARRKATHPRRCSSRTPYFYSNARPMTSEQKSRCKMYLDHNPVWGGDGFYCSKCMMPFSPSPEGGKTPRCSSSPLCSHNTNGRDLDKPCSISAPHAQEKLPSTDSAVVHPSTLPHHDHIGEAMERFRKMAEGNEFYFDKDRALDCWEQFESFLTRELERKEGECNSTWARFCDKEVKEKVAKERARVIAVIEKEAKELEVIIRSKNGGKLVTKNEPHNSWLTGKFSALTSLKATLSDKEQI